MNWSVALTAAAWTLGLGLLSARDVSCSNESPSSTLSLPWPYGKAEGEKMISLSRVVAI